MSTAVLRDQPAHQEPAPSRGPERQHSRRVKSAQANPARSGPLVAARAQALFTSDLSAQAEHTQAEVAAAIRHAFDAHGGLGGCVAEVATAYGEHPETAARRMRWARAVVQGIDDFEAALDPAQEVSWAQVSSDTPKPSESTP